MSHQPNNIAAGTQVVSLIGILGANNGLVHPRGAVGVVTRTPCGDETQFLVRFPDGYAMSQFKKIEQDVRNHGRVLWKHAMHLLRLLISGAATLREGHVSVRVEVHRERLLAVKRGELAWPEVDAGRQELHRDFEAALVATRLPERPDYDAANRFLLKARRSMAHSFNP